MTLAFVLRYFQNWRMETIFLALVPAEAFFHFGNAK
jgi:hypothetical protein